MQGVSEIHSLTVNVQSLHHEMLLLELQVANRKQTLKCCDHSLPRQFVSPTQHPFQFNQEQP